MRNHGPAKYQKITQLGPPKANRVAVSDREDLYEPFAGLQELTQNPAKKKERRVAAKEKLELLKELRAFQHKASRKQPPLI